MAAQRQPCVPPAADEECRQLRQAQQISRVGSWRYELSGPTLTVSDALLNLYGLARAGFGGRYEALDRRVHPDDRQPLLAAVYRLRRSGQPMVARYRVIHPGTGRQRWFDARGIAEYDSAGNVTHLAGTVADVTELVQAEMDVRRAHTELSQAHSHQQAVIAATPDAIHIYDVAGQILTRANRSGKALIGFTDEAASVIGGGGGARLLPADDCDEVERALRAARTLADGDVVSVRHRVSQRDGQTRWLSRRMTPFARDEQGAVTQILVISRDVTDVVVIEQRLEHAALHDELTGLPNRRLIRDRIEQCLRAATRGGHVAVLSCDLDGFKRINDSRGHSVGDDVLIQTAARLVAATRPADTVARLGGDEFVVLLDIPQQLNPMVVAETVSLRIAAALAEPITLGGYQHTVTASIGISLAPDATDASTADSLLRDADAAMYHVKSRGSNGHAFFHTSQRPDTAGRDLLEREIRRALAEDDLAVHYQPIVDPRTASLHGVEALLRIRASETGRFLNTAQVISVAEQTGLIAELDERVLRIACAQAALWRSEPSHAELTLKLNRSAKDITRPGFYERITDALVSTGLAAQALTIEITETVLLDANEENLATLRRLRAHGVGLAIDDFGTGYASLRYLAELPINCIKVDRSFTSRLPHDRTSMTLVRATIGLAEQLGIDCIVEGVETTRQLAALPDYDRLLIQGYLYARPQPASEPLRSHIPAGSSQPGENSLGVAV